ncbi:MAG TPA: AAA family ATPase [Thermoleophilaceae bacterium]|jgi:hypothetical protein
MGAEPGVDARFVGRADELARLESALRSAVGGSGSLVFVAGQPGVGKSVLLRRTAGRAREDPELSEARFATGSSYEMTGPHDVLQPFREALLDLSAGDDERHWGKAVLGVLKEVGPDLLQLVPGLGAGLALGARAAIGATSAFSLSDDSHGATAPLLAEQLAEALLEIGRREAPLSVVVEDAHWIDPVSAELLLRLAERLPASRVLVTVTYRPAELADGNPLAAVLRSALVAERATRIELGGLSVADVELYLVRRFGSLPHPLLGEWLHEVSEGHPLFATQYVSLLEEAGVVTRSGDGWTLDGSLERGPDGWSVTGPLADEALPDDLTRDERVSSLLESRVTRLEDEERRLLEIAAVQGRRFWSLVVAEAAGVGEEEVLGRLRELAERHRLIRAVAGDAWVQRTSDVYEFEHMLLQRAFYSKLTPRQRLMRHGRVAAAMEPLLDSHPDPSSQVILELARHHELGGDGAAAARGYLDATDAAFAQGAFEQAVRIGGRGLTIARSVEGPGPEERRTLAMLAAGVLAASELRWRGDDEQEGDDEVEALVDEGAAAAREAGDHATLARLEYSRAKVALQRERLPNCIAALRDALVHAERGEDPIARLMVMSALGHHLASQSLDEGLETLRAARRLAEGGAIEPRTRREERAAARQLALLHGYEGVGEFDAGRFGPAEDLLVRATDSLRGLGVRDDLPINLGFLAQLRTATGSFEAAEETLAESLAIVEELPGHGHAGYVRSLRIKLMLEWERPDEARSAVERAWSETRQSRFANVLPLVRNVLAEALMSGDAAAADVEAAREHLTASIADSERSAFARGQVTARTLLARLLRRRGDPDAALEESSTACRLLEAAGGRMPAVRAEEVLFEHALCAREAGDAETYGRMLEAACGVLGDKAQSLPDADARRTFLDRVPLSRSILEAVEDGAEA